MTDRVLSLACVVMLVLGRGDLEAQQVNSYKPPATIIQTGSSWDPKSNIRVELALVAADESAAGVQGIPTRVHSWRERGYRVFGFASLARVYDYYMKGGWRDLTGTIDGGGHEGEIQRDRTGAKFGPHEFMLTPSRRLMEHKKLWAKAFIEAKVEGMVFEEPDIFMAGGYDDQFKKEWAEHYREPWQPPHSSVEARIKSERLKAYLGLRSYQTLAEYCKREGGSKFKFTLATHSLPNYMLWGVSFNYYDTLSLPSVDILQAQVWTGTAKTPILFEGKMVERMFDNAYLDYSYCANLAEATGKEVWNNLDPFEDDPSLTFEFYKRGFENTLAASMMFPNVKQWELLPWPNRIYSNDRIQPLYGAELQNVLTAMTAMAGTTNFSRQNIFPRTGVLFSETALQEMREPMPSNPQSLFALALPLLTLGVAVDVVPLEGVINTRYLSSFKVLLLSYDACKPTRPEIHRALTDWVKSGGVLLIFGGMNAYNAAPSWWREAGYDSPMAHLLEMTGAGNRKLGFVPQRPKDIKVDGVMTTVSNRSAYLPFVNGLFAGLKGQDFIPRRTNFAPDGQHPELNYLFLALEPGRVLPDFVQIRNRRAGARFCDATGQIIYKFDTRHLKEFKLKVDIANGYLIESSSDARNWSELANSIKRFGGEVRDGGNRNTETLDLSSLCGGEAYVRFSDPSPQDGWGPLLLRIGLEPVLRDGAKIPDSAAPLANRDSYAIAYKGIEKTKHILLRGEGNEPISFTHNGGEGEIIVIGAPPVLFGGSKENSDRLRNLYTAVCRQHNLAFQVAQGHHLQRGDYHLLFNYAERMLAGRYLDVLSPGLEILYDPKLEAGKPYLLLDMREIPFDQPKILFASHQTEVVAADNSQIRLRVEGPERIPSVCRVLAPTSGPEKVTAVRLRDGMAVPCKITKDEDGTLHISTPNQSGGVEVAIRLR